MTGKTPNPSPSPSPSSSSSTSQARIPNLWVTALITIVITLVMTVLGIMTDSFSTPQSAAAKDLTIAPAVAFHLATVVPALLLGPFILWRKKGDRTHRFLGRIWAGLMLVTAIASAFIGAPGGGIAGSGFSPIHIFTVWTLVNVPLAIWFARQGKIRAHKGAMTGLYVGLCIAGAFTLVPGRLLGNLVFG